MPIFFPSQAGRDWHIGGEIDDSRWKKRAWTYQEAFFTRRRLVCTKDEVYFDCLETCGHEIFNFKQVGEDSYEPNQLWSLPKRYPGKNTDQLDVLDHISKISERILSHPEDVIRALIGLLHTFEVDIGVVHYWGIPLLKQDSYARLSEWDVTEALFLGLQWLTTSTWDLRQRRSFGPSWS